MEKYHDPPLPTSLCELVDVLLYGALSRSFTDSAGPTEVMKRLLKKYFVYVLVCFRRQPILHVTCGSCFFEGKVH